MPKRRAKGEGSLSPLMCNRCGRRPQKSRGWCKICYENMRSRHPERLPPKAPRPTVEERFWAKVDKSGDCWIWTACLHDAGYGQFGVGVDDKRYAHRMAYEWLVGPIPDGLQIDHLCRVRACCNPDHLEVVTPGENYIRGAGFSGVNHRKVECPKGHAYDDVNTYIDAKGQRHCRTCRRGRDRGRSRSGGRRAAQG